MSGLKVRQLRGPSELGRLVVRQIDIEGKSYATIAKERGITATEVQCVYLEAKRVKRRQDELGYLAELDDSTIAALRRAMKTDHALALLDIRLFLQEPGWKTVLASVTNGIYEAVLLDVETFAMANGITPARDTEPPTSSLRLVS
ncbi:MAG: hypothetical protein PHF60_05095 [Candidatus ainarchaeum sp.]|nr:hypothetical protein [Candidatus ainarchaeum sp.]